MPKDCYQDGVGVGVGAGAVSKVCPNADGTPRQISAVKNASETLVFLRLSQSQKVEIRLKMLTDV